MDAMFSLWTWLLGRLTELLCSAYLALSLVAIASKYIPALEELASHGKTRNSMSNKMLVPKRWFVHFYVLGLWSVGVVCYTAGQLTDNKITKSNLISPVFIARVLLLLHLCRRAYECLFVQQYGNSQMHILGYALGMGHYLVLPLVFWSIGVEEDLDGQTSTDDNNLPHLPALLALLLCNLWMQYEQYRHHLILAQMRVDRSKKDDGDPSSNTNSSSNRYMLPPKQRWFQRVLCPHYLAEILLYVSFVMLLEWHQQQNIKQWNELNRRDVLWRCRHVLLLVWVTTNLTISAWNNYQWYAATFPEKLQKRGQPDETVDGRTALWPLRCF